MANLRLLSIEKRKSCKRKDSSKRWVAMKNPETGVSDPSHYDISCFSDVSYKSFFRENNEIVELARKNDIELDEVYNRFFELGMRVSQQIDGAVRKRTEASYYSQQKELENLLLQRVRERFEKQERQAFNSALESLSASGISPEEYERAKTFVPTRPVEESKKRFFHNPSLTEKVDEMRRKTTTEFLQYIPELPVGLRVRFLDVISLYRRGLEEVDIIRDCSDDISDILKVLGEKHGAIYLDMLKQNANCRDVYDDYIRGMKKQMEDLTPEQRDTFFKKLEETKDIGEAFISIDERFN